LSRVAAAAPPGVLEVLSRTPEDAAEAIPIALEAWARGPRHAAFVELAGARAYLKLTALSGKTRWRYALKRQLLRAPLPRLREFANLRWLREHGFRAPEPLVAAALWRRGLPRFQLLFTREVAGARTLAQFLVEERGARRAAVLDDLAREVARMHALGFVHHDLFPRNLLVTAGEDRVWFLDCWAGGPPPQARGPAYDLACLTRSGAPDALLAEDGARVLAAYESARRANPSP